MSDELLELTANVVTAMVSNNAVDKDALPGLIRSVHDALAALGQEPAAAEPDAFIGAVSVRKSLADPTKIISMIDGKPYSTLRRHLGTHGLTPDEYRARYGLKPDYPMVAPAYSQRRVEIARTLGLGRKAKSVEAAFVDAVAHPIKAARRKLKLALGQAPENAAGEHEEQAAVS